MHVDGCFFGQYVLYDGTDSRPDMFIILPTPSFLTINPTSLLSTLGLVIVLMAAEFLYRVFHENTVPAVCSIVGPPSGDASDDLCAAFDVKVEPTVGRMAAFISFANISGVAVDFIFNIGPIIVSVGAGEVSASGHCADNFQAQGLQRGWFGNKTALWAYRSYRVDALR